MIEILINNKSHKLDAETTISDLLGDLSIQREGTAIAVNERVIPRSEHGSFKLSDGDRLEIIRAVGGG